MPLKIMWSFWIIIAVSGNLVMLPSCKTGKDLPNHPGGFLLLIEMNGGEIIESGINVNYPEGEIEKKGKNQYKIHIHTENASFAEIAYDDDIFLIYGNPGDTLILAGNSTQLFREADFKGDKSNENNYLILLHQKEKEKSFDRYLEIMSLTESEFLKAAENLYQTDLNYFQEYQKINGVFTKEFADLALVELKYKMVNLKMDYPSEYKFLNNPDSFKLSDTYYSFFQNLDTDNEEKLSAPAYRSFLPKYLNYLVTETFANDTVSVAANLEETKMKSIKRHFQSPEIQSFLQYILMDDFFENDYNAAFHLYEYYLENQKTEFFLELIKGKYKDLKHLKPGSSLPVMKLFTDQNNEFNIHSLKGKVIYLDIWASWCAPCKREFPYFDKLVGQYKNRDDIFFAGISLDDDKNTWLQYLKSKNSDFTQLWDEQNWEAEWVKYFNIESIPRFILIDKNGKIVNANAPRPSDPSISVALDQLLINE